MLRAQWQTMGGRTATEQLFTYKEFNRLHPNILVPAPLLARLQPPPPARDDETSPDNEDDTDGKVEDNNETWACLPFHQGGSSEFYPDRKHSYLVSSFIAEAITVGRIRRSPAPVSPAAGTMASIIDCQPDRPSHPKPGPEPASVSIAPNRIALHRIRPGFSTLLSYDISLFFPGSPPTVAV
ncbi:hypothetical protein LX36DRAFT_666030 [Colletotrichum falcatum]|nr:hypothetical protein LX36DRAFT_666030 [Colletotrichum falcatum]